MIFDKEKMIKILDDFKEIYLNRPITNNDGGMKSPHLFPLYYYLRTYKPEIIIESGIWKGQGTWLIETVLPNSTIYSIDINLNRLVYKSDKVIYLNKDITTINWLDKIDSSKKTLVFLDDHQDFNKRIDFLINNNLKDIIFEDNYPLGQGDCVSPKKLLNEETSSFFKYYEEAPPIFIDNKTRWGDNWIENYNTRDHLLQKSDEEKYELFYEERFDYTWISYVKLI